MKGKNETGKATRTRKSELMTVFLFVMERVSKRRITTEEIQSQEWRERRDAFIKLFMPVLEEREGGAK